MDGWMDGWRWKRKKRRMKQTEVRQKMEEREWKRKRQGCVGKGIEAAEVRNKGQAEGSVRDGRGRTGWWLRAIKRSVEGSRLEDGEMQRL